MEILRGAVRGVDGGSETEYDCFHYIALVGSMSAKQRAARTGRLAWALIIPAFLVLLLLGAVVAGPGVIQSHPALVTDTVDRVRAIVGPKPVSVVEGAYYRLLDVYNRLHYQATGQTDTWQLAIAATPVVQPTSAAPTTPVPVPATTSPGALGTPDIVPTDQKPSTSTPRVTPAPAQAVLVSQPPPIKPLIQNPPLSGEGEWRPLATLGQPAGEPPILWQTLLRPDPSRPFAQVVLVAMDLSRSRLHIVVGVKEPASNVPPRGLRTGMIPPSDQKGGELLAAWNGGFKAIHGHYGMMTDGTVWVPPIDGLATAAVDADGRLTLGAWGRGVDPNGPWTAWRQNNPPLIEDGVVNPDVIRLADTIHWGASLSGAVFIWRSGMGVTPDGRWLIYAAGNPLSVQTLTSALQAAGAWNAMQLDVNMSFEHYDTFAATPQTISARGSTISLPVTSVKLIKQMFGDSTQFLVPFDRDFFYMTYRGQGS